MACCDAPLLGQLQGVMNELAGLSSNISGSGAPCCQQPCCPPPMPVCTGCCPPPPHPICCMPCPPPLVLPTLPEPVKPLMMPVEKCENRMSDEEQFIYRHANFYNNYNIDWKTEAIKPCGPPSPDPRSDIKSKTGVTIDGKNPLCPCGPKKNDCCTDKGCPTGFKPCVMKMRPPANCHPCGLWCAEIQECPPKLVGKSNGQRPCPKDSDICPIHCVPVADEHKGRGPDPDPGCNARNQMWGPWLVKCSARRASDMVETRENENREVGNYYNNYGIDYREEMLWKHTTPTGKTVERKGIEQGVTLSGQSARCPLENKPYEDKRKKTGDNKKHATNNIPCMFKFTPSPDCSGAWCVEIKPRPDNTGEKIKKTPKRNEMKPCTRPCCKHWKLKEGDCQYDLPCKAACFNHPPGMKPKYHVPEIDYELLKVLGERYNNPTN